MVMAKHITKAQLRQIYQAQLFDNDEYLRLLKEFAGIESRPTTEYNHYDEKGEFIGSSVDTDAQYAVQRCAHGGTTSAVSAGRRWMEGTTMDDLKALVDALVILNDDNLAQTVIDNNDVQRCLSELQDMLAADMEPVVRCKDCKYGVSASKPNGAIVCLRTNGSFWRKETDFCSYGERREE